MLDNVALEEDIPAHTVVPGIVKTIAATRPTATIFVVREVSDLFVCLFV